MASPAPASALAEEAAVDARAPETERDGRRWSRWRRAWFVLAALALIAVLVPVLARLFGIETGPLAILVALMPWVTVACVVPVVLALVARAWWLVAASAAVLVLCLIWAVPMFTAQHALGGGVVRVATINLTFGQADVDAVVELVRDHEVNILAAQEVTPEAVEALRAAGLDDLLPYSEVAAEPGVTGTGLWSRSPLSKATTLDTSDEVEKLGGYVSQAVKADVDVAGQQLTVFAIHPAAPGLTAHASWDADLSRLTDVLAGQSGPTLVLGDFNTTRDHRAFREIQALGYADAADQAGAGFLPTFPEGRGPWPFVAIDHALVGHVDFVATSVSTASIPGADHRMLLVTYGAA
ncbi:endonuclease/exonuclease/phosphatase family protein [Demequina aurantiaca]|uniref:endonuclease/exonuclease/phosphatase family protein n=1 Tax=Demequina aurantiaca TaxID=676200 RepID=UPI000781B758|nr:endonuclease/exonuclease/phosphatase family protein [Demequina aurantiaca]